MAFPWKLFPTPGEEVGFAQWESYPKGLLISLRRLKKYNLPVMITELGMPHGFNCNPAEYLKEATGYLSQAVEEGINVQGFFYWSLLDNFEWSEGTSVRFGLYEIDYETQARKLKEVGRVYKSLVEKGVE